MNKRRPKGKSYRLLKQDLAELADATLAPIRDRYFKLEANRDLLRKILGQGAERAQPLAQATLQRVKRRIGLA